MQSLGVASSPQSDLPLHVKRGCRGPPRFSFIYGARLSQKVSFSEATFPVQSFSERSEIPKSLPIRGLRHLRKYFPGHLIPA